MCQVRDELAGRSRWELHCSTMDDFSNQDDLDLISAIAKRDKNAFSELFSRYAVRVKAFLMKGGTPEQDADELAQEVMLTVWRKANLFDPTKAAVSTWIFTIARNRRIDRFRRNARPEPDPNDPLFQPDPEPTSRQALTTRQIGERVRQEIKALPEAQREVLTLAFFGGLTHGEVSQHLDIPLGTVKSRVRLAFKTLRSALGEHMAEEYRDD